MNRASRQRGVTISSLSSAKPIRVLIVDDHQLVREGLRAYLETWKEIEVVGEAADGREAVLLVAKFRPDLVIMDVSMPGLNGIEATHQIRSTQPDTRVIGLTMHDSATVRGEMINAGASCCLSKTAAANELIPYIEELRGPVESAAARRERRESPVFGLLSSREREVLQLLAEGWSIKETAYTLKLSPKTVSVHRCNIMRKLELDSLADLIRYALRLGLTDLEPSIQ